MPRDIQPVVSEPVERPDKGTRDTHPAFGVAVIHRSQVTPGAVLFQSDLRHRETITLAVHRSDRTRTLAHDWTHPGETLIEIEMSLAQWGALVSAQGIGGGVPVTIRRTETEPFVPGIPYQSRLAESIGEVKGEAAALIERANRTLADLQEAVKSGRIGAIKEALRAHEGSIQYVESNSEFYVKSMQDAAEKVVSNARADIEAHILGSQRLVGGASIEAPDAPVLAVER
jgi:hypothetical protein